MDLPRIQVLVVEDDREDFELTRIRLEKTPLTYQLEWAASYEEAKRMIWERRHDVCLLDYRIGPSSGVQLLQEAKQAGIALPFILLTGYEGYDLDLSAMKAGAEDFLSKNDLTPQLLERSIRYTIEGFRDRQALRHSEEFNRRILENSPDIVAIVDANGKVVSLHPGRLALNSKVGDFTLSESDWFSHWHEQDRPLARDAIRSASDGAVRQFEARHATSDGKTWWFDVIVTPMAGCEGQVDRWLVVARDITRIKEAKAELSRLNSELESRVEQRTTELRNEIAEHETTERQLAHANDILRRKNEEIQNFYHTLSHELKTPLTAAREFVCILMDGLAGQVNPTQMEYLTIARDSCDQLRVCLNDLLDATRLETGKLHLDPKPQSLGRLVRRVVESLRPKASDKRLALETTVADDLPEVMLDETRITQVATNLINNALKYTPDGGTIRVAVQRSTRDPDCVEVSICDSGRGIPVNHLERIFDRLHQVKSGDAATEQGIGLGLYLCRELVLLHGGEIWADSAEGKGSTFHFLLKAHQPEHRVRVMAVDDDPELLAGIERALRRAGYDVATAGNGADAWAGMERMEPDLVVLDLIMPAMDGADLLRAIRNRWKSMPVIIYTGYPEGDVIAKAMAFSPFTLLAKPCQVGEMAETVRKVLKQNDTMIWRKRRHQESPETASTSTATL